MSEDDNIAGIFMALRGRLARAVQHIVPPKEIEDIVQETYLRIRQVGGGSERYDDVNRRRGENPCLDYFDNRYRGYTLLEFGHKRIAANLRVVDDVTVEDSPVSALATLIVDDGKAGVRQSRSDHD